MRFNNRLTVIISFSLAFVFSLNFVTFAQEKYYVCTKHNLAILKKICPIDNKRLDESEERYGICLEDRYFTKIEAPKSPGCCPMCGIPLCLAFLYYYCNRHPDKISFKKGSDRCPICKTYITMRRIVLKYYCPKCGSWFAEPTKDMVCPICRGVARILDRTLMVDED